MNSAGWIRICGNEEDELARELGARLERRIAAGQVNPDEIRRVEKLTFLPSSRLELSSQALDKLRRLCQLWDVDLRCQTIRSHRPLIGPVIVAVKKLFYPVLRVFLKDTLRQQSDFNAAAVSLLADLAGAAQARQTQADSKGAARQT